ncbi:hypothetical protein F7725_005148 [Dissostichus mawsoni]|uniref:Centrosomal protein of 44 kDa n=1 Tax=Dissostichus mawsoni TaxID=36200 RepID=A0A7J5YRL9_DISMA|nr:hypothetical protein F7725_005148 [Dissostichus mawsoni]
MKLQRAESREQKPSSGLQREESRESVQGPGSRDSESRAVRAGLRGPISSVSDLLPQLTLSVMEKSRLEWICWKTILPTRAAWLCQLLLSVALSRTALFRGAACGEQLLSPNKTLIQRADSRAQTEEEVRDRKQECVNPPVFGGRGFCVFRSPQKCVLSSVQYESWDGSYAATCPIRTKAQISDQVGVAGTESVAELVMRVSRYSPLSSGRGCVFVISEVLPHAASQAQISSIQSVCELFLKLLLLSGRQPPQCLTHLYAAQQHGKMLSNGDVNACLRKLETLLRTIKYPGHVDYNGLSKGDPSAFLPIVSFTLTSFSPPFANQLMEDGLELMAKRTSDSLTLFIRKISVICDIINLVLQKHNLLKKMSKKPVVENHMGNCSISPTNSSHAEAFSSHIVTHISHNEVHSSTSPREGELAGQGVDNDHLLYSSEVEGRLSALEAQLGSVVCVLDRLSVLEERMEERDQHRNTDKDEEQVITISRESWENLMSRLLLLETKVDLNNIQLSVPPQCPSCPCASNYSSSSMSDASKGDIKDRLDRITNMLKSTSSLLKITESSS